jgi:NitT/TauT family transport system ATP-binding protein/sulfonate transport system ATP-binding protein
VGKSTLLRMIAGIDRAYTGTIGIDGKAPAEAPPPGYVFQDPRLLPWKTALGNLLIARPEATVETARAILAGVGLAGSEDAYPHQLSGGMQRRVALARAMLVNPRFWLFDEPFVSLDRTLVDELQVLFLRHAAEAKPTVVFVTHVPEEAARLATRAVILAGHPARIAADLVLEVDPALRESKTVAGIAQAIAAASR